MKNLLPKTAEVSCFAKGSYDFWLRTYARELSYKNVPAVSVMQALEIEERYKISFWDALIVQAAGSCGVEAIYSEDLADGQSYGDVRVINPLK